jgi:hypothetical protein
MNISKALKVKNRLAGEVSKLQDIVRRENSRRSDNPSKINVEEAYGSLFNIINSLIALKSSISRASAPISDKLSQLSELKTHVNWVSSLPTREGVEKVSYGHSKDVHDYEWTAFFNRERLDAEVETLQEEINKLQDEVDDYNAKTSVDYNN